MMRFVLRYELIVDRTPPTLFGPLPPPPPAPTDDEVAAVSAQVAVIGSEEVVAALNQLMRATAKFWAEAQGWEKAQPQKPIHEARQQFPRARAGA
jgi:hypothetical protein